MTVGGRGSSSGVSTKGIHYGTEYHTILQSGNIKFIRKNIGGASAPLETMSAHERRIYVTVNAKDVVKSVTLFSEDGLREREIHLDHFHGGLKPHTHVGYDNRTGRDEAFPLNPREKAIVSRVLGIWKEYNNGRR
jgi:hypothetical protein